MRSSPSTIDSGRRRRPLTRSPDVPFDVTAHVPCDPGLPSPVPPSPITSPSPPPSCVGPAPSGDGFPLSEQAVSLRNPTAEPRQSSVQNFMEVNVSNCSLLPPLAHAGRKYFGFRVG